MRSLSHLDATGQACMVDVTAKGSSVREARATGTVRMRPETLALILSHGLPKGDAFGVARVAGIQAAKKTGELIPLCHPLALTHVDLQFETDPVSGCVTIEVSVRAIGPTGVEMEALTAVAVAALTLYDMCKAVDKSIIMSDILLKEKKGGKSGHYVRSDPPAGHPAS